MNMEDRMATMETNHQVLQDKFEKFEKDLKEEIAQAQQNTVRQIALMLGFPDPKRGKAEESIPVEDSPYILEKIDHHDREQSGMGTSRTKVQFSTDPAEINSGITHNHDLEIEIPNFDEVDDKSKTERKLEDRCEKLEEMIRSMQNAGTFGGIDARELSLVSDLVIPPKFKVPEFEKFTGTTCPSAHLTMYCRKMSLYLDNEKLLIHCFQDSLVGSAARWYTQLSRAHIKTWRDLSRAFLEQYKHLSDMVPIPRYIAPIQPPYPPWFNPNVKCDYHAGNPGHHINDCTAFKYVVEQLLKAGMLSFEAPEKNPMPNHKGVNAVIEGSNRRVKESLADVTAPLKWVWERLLENGILNTDHVANRTDDFCEYHQSEGHEIQECEEFRWLIQAMMDNKELEFFSKGRDYEVQDVCVIDDAPTLGNFAGLKPLIIKVGPKGNKDIAATTSALVIKAPAPFPYKDSKQVPWKYECQTVRPQRAEENVNEVGNFTRSGRCYSTQPQVEPTKNQKEKAHNGGQDKNLDDEPEPEYHEPVKETEAKEFLKILKHSEFNVVEQLNKLPAKISMLSLLLSSEPHRNTLLKLLNQTFVPKEISIDMVDWLVGNIAMDNFISFSDEEIPKGARGSYKALHITTRCKGHTLPGVLIDNGSALNVLPVTTLKKLPIDSTHKKAYHNTVKAFDGTQRDVLGKITVPLLIGPADYEVDFVVMDIKPTYSCLLGRPWIHAAGAVPSTLHQKLKFVIDGKLVTVRGEEDIIASIATDTPYIEMDEDAVECTFRSLELVSATFVEETKEVCRSKLSRCAKMQVKQTLGRGARIGRGFGRQLQGRLYPIYVKDEFTNEDLSSYIENLTINTITEGDEETPYLGQIGPCLPGSELNNWIAEELPVIFKTNTEVLDINGVSNIIPDSQVDFGQNLSSEEFTDCEDDEGCDLPNDLRRMMKYTRQNLIKLLQEYIDVFAWSYQDMPGLDEDIAMHRLPIKSACKPVQQKLRRMKPEILLKIRDEVKKQFDAGFLQAVTYSDWVANIVPVPKKDGKVRMCVDYRDLNRASPKDNFPLPHIDTLVDNTADHSYFSFMDGFSGYNQIKMCPDDMNKTTCDPVYKLLRKNNPGEWNDECQTALERIKRQLTNAPILVPPVPERPLILYLMVFENSMGCVLGQHDDSGKKERAIYYLSKKFTEYETKYSPVEKLCCALVWATKRLRQYMLYHTTWLISKLDPLKYMMESSALSGRLARWQMLLSEFDILYVSRKAVKGSAIANFLASRASDDYEPLDYKFPDEDLLNVSYVEESNTKKSWVLYFDGASNFHGHGIGAMLISPEGDYHPFAGRLEFFCTNNMAEYEACAMGLRAAIDQKFKALEVFGDSSVFVRQIKGEWETRDPKLIEYQKLILELAKEFKEVTFAYLPREDNRIADALATFAALFVAGNRAEMMPIRMQIFENPVHCCEIEEEADGNPWYYDILRYIKFREYPSCATENDKRIIRRMAVGYVLDGEVLYKRGSDQVLMRCVNAKEAQQIIEEVHEGICGTHPNGFTMARRIMRFGYYWSTMESDCISYARKCHKCQIYADKLHTPPQSLHVMTSPWPFSTWGLDVIGPIFPKASNGHRFIFVVIDYFTKWVEAASFANVTESVICRFIKKEIICRFGLPERIVSDNAKNLNSKMMEKICEQFKIKHHRSVTYRPKMNGAVKAANKNIKRIVAKMTTTYRDWHEKLPFALLAYRTSVRTSTGATPYSLVMGQK
ncbi:hypothetical protein V6N13_040208 [Hibiscus sabdariffa]